MIQYADFSLKIEPKRGDVYPVIVLRSPAGEGRSQFALPFDPNEIGDILFDLGETFRSGSQEVVREAAPGATRTRPQQIGDQLFTALFSGPVRSLLDRSLGMIHSSKQGLRVKLHIDPEDATLAQLTSLPWELMYRKETREFLNLSSFTPIVRYLDVQVPCIPLPLEPPLRILVVISSPMDYDRLDLERERRQIEETWARQEDVAVDFLQPATILELQDRLTAAPYHALHYMGHGGFDQRTGRGVLIFEDERGYGVPLDGSTLGVLLRDVPTLRLAFLNACDTARVTKQEGLDPFAGVAAAMVMAGIPAVVAMQFPITDGAAIRFANRLYPLLADGRPVDYAVAQGRQAILAAEGGTTEWATPVLLMRAPEGTIFRVSEAHQARRRLRQPPTIDTEDLAQQMEELYIAGLGAFWLEEWDKAVRSFETIAAVRPDYQDVAAKLQEARRRQKWDGLYEQAQAARATEDWGTVIAVLDALVTEKADFKDAAALLELARRHRQLADLYTQAQRLHAAANWQAVINVFAQIHTLDPDHADPDDLLPTAERELAEQERQAALSDLFGRAVRAMDAGEWAEAHELLAQVQEAEPGYRGADRLLARAQAEIARREAERQRQEELAALYSRAVDRARAGQWAQALAVMDDIRALEPQFEDPEGIEERARTEVERQRRLEALYAQALAARDTGDWPETLSTLQELVAEDAGYRDAAALLAEAKEQQELAGLYAQARQQHGARDWQAVVDTFARISALEPGYADPEGLLPAAQRSLAEQEREAELDDLYRRAGQALDAGHWPEAQRLLTLVQDREPGYRESEQRLAVAEAEMERAEAERHLREQIATLYEQAQSLARARQWQQALDKMDEVLALDAGFDDPEGVAARAQEQVARQEQEARRQNELAALYAEAVRLVKADQYQEALETWAEVQALDPRYPDRKKVQATARKKLAALARPQTGRRLPRWALIAIAGLALVALTVGGLWLGGALGGGTLEPTSTEVPAVAAVAATQTPTNTSQPPTPSRTAQATATATPTQKASSTPIPPTATSWLVPRTTTKYTPTPPTATPTRTRRPTPVPTATMDADPTVYDNFNNPAYDGSYRDDLWSFWTDDPEGSASQQDGGLRLSANPGKGVELELRYDNDVALETPIFFEARVQLGPASGPAHLRIALGGTDESFMTGCSLHATPDDSYANCGWYHEPLWSDNIEIARGTWYTIRIEVDPTTMAFTDYVNGQQLWTGIPASADRLRSSRFWFQIALHNRKEDPETASIDVDDVRIGPVRTATPTSTATMDADPTVYDNFNNSAYDGSYRHDLWSFSTDDPEASATQQDGVLRLSVSPDQSAGLYLRHYFDIALETPMFFEARFKLGPASGPYQYTLGFRDQLSHLFSADCSVRMDPEQPNLHCKWNEPNALVATEPMDVARRTWYTLRIEVDPSTMEFTYFVDGQQVLAEIPASADRLMTSQFDLSFEIWNDSESSETVVVFLDDVRVGPIE